MEQQQQQQQQQQQEAAILLLACLFASWCLGSLVSKHTHSHTVLAFFFFFFFRPTQTTLQREEQRILRNLAATYETIFRSKTPDTTKFQRLATKGKRNRQQKKKKKKKKKENEESSPLTQSSHKDTSSSSSSSPSLFPSPSPTHTHARTHIMEHHTSSKGGSSQPPALSLKLRLPTASHPVHHSDPMSASVDSTTPTISSASSSPSVFNVSLRFSISIQREMGRQTGERGRDNETQRDQEKQRGRGAETRTHTYKQTHKVL